MSHTVLELDLNALSHNYDYLRSKLEPDVKMLGVVKAYAYGSASVAVAKKLEEKGKIEKANKRYEKALEYLIKSNEKEPNQADTLNYLGFALRKLGNFEEAEKYYLLGLNIKPDHQGINEYLGELYIITDRMDLAKERLEVLKNCNCEEYDELKELIDKN